MLLVILWERLGRFQIMLDSFAEVGARFNRSRVGGRLQAHVQIIVSDDPVPINSVDN